MFRLEYCDDPNNPILSQSDTICSDDFDVIFDTYVNKLDRFYYLVDMFKIIESCTYDLVDVTVTSDEEFWSVNKYLLSYVNAVYSLKEFVNSYDPPLKGITDNYFLNMKWYRFVCEYRNRVIHQSLTIKDYMPGSNDIFINLNEVIEIQENLIFKKINHKINSEKFISLLDELKSDSIIIKGEYFLSMKDVAKCASREIESMRDQVYMFVYKEAIKPVIEWLISQIPKVDGEYKYAFIVDKDNPPDAVCEPNYALDSFCVSVSKRLGSDNEVSQTIRELLEDMGYVKFFD